MLLVGFGLGVLALMFVTALRDFRHLLVGKVYLLIIVSATAFLIDPLMPPGWRWLSSDLQTALPGLFWLLCQLIFARRPQWKTVWGAMALYSFLVPALARPFVIKGVSPDIQVFFGWTLGQWFEYAVVLHGLSLVVRHWRDDLVEMRRRARLGFLLVIGGSTAVATVCLNFGWYTEHTRGVITSVAGFVALVFLTRSWDGILELAAAPRAPQKEDLVDESEYDAGADPLLQKDELQLAELMAAGFYRTEKLTLRKLSDKIEIPEYRLRKVINQTLGYRNFNDYINQLRVAEAAERLLDDAQVPVLNVSLDVGYRTLSSFNRAFREIKNTTPTEYRQQHLEGSDE
ncbi:helix-turn-helix domain-containing protein [Marinobacter zhejiangensis]|uniref:Transcriptional regulator, AraC family n=1 Tax=Marinobacter zhejiangensis TaxID=488535 RepID=A0A1I4NF52_9GAMM|nr:helix-turn-helix domain-containing protein [Marinobacter zhejiangensis]SFM14016.1 transcriptional regulator, AraC family [Marinobacter zhejiangensis]